MEGSGNWGLIIGVTITGLVVVFLALTILIVVISIMGKIIDSKRNDKKNQETKQNTVSHKIEPVVEKVSKPIIQGGISGETVAVISAAIACTVGADNPVAIKSISKTVTPPASGRSVWRLAGITDNTRPF